MRKAEIQRLVGRLLALGVLASCLVFFSVERSARAFTCCDTCNSRYASCFNGCAGDLACQESCGNQFDTCESRCWTVYHQLC